jgi:predicted permease
MRFLTRITSGLRALLRSKRVDADLDEELAGFREALVADRIRRGMTRDEATLAANRELGPIGRVKEGVREVGWESRFDDLWQDVRYAIRALRRSPGFASVAILTLALGIGANAAIFSVVNAVLIRPLPFPEPDRLVRIFETYAGPLGRPLRMWLPAEDLRQLRSASRTLSNVDAYGVFVELRLGRDEDVEIGGARVSHSTLAMLDARTALGRLFDERESAAMDPVMVLGHAAWQRHFGADPSVVGRTVTVEGTFPMPYGSARQVFTVIGVMAEDFQFPTGQTAFWIPLNVDREGGQGSIARLNPGVSPEAATSELVSLFGRDRPESRFEVVRLQDEYASSLRPALVVLLAAVGLVLLIACANLANLQLARATARHRELAMRGALGAGRGRLIRQLMTESLVIAVPGGAAGLLLAFGGVAVLRTLLADLVTRADLTQVGADLGRPAALPLIEPRLDLRTLLFTGLVCVLVGLVSGTAPAFAAPLRDAMKALHEGGASAIASFGLLRRNALRSGLVVAQGDARHGAVDRGRPARAQLRQAGDRRSRLRAQARIDLQRPNASWPVDSHGDCAGGTRFGRAPPIAAWGERRRLHLCPADSVARDGDGVSCVG